MQTLQHSGKAHGLHYLDHCCIHRLKYIVITKPTLLVKLWVVLSSMATTAQFESNFLGSITGESHKVVNYKLPENEASCKYELVDAKTAQVSKRCKT